MNDKPPENECGGCTACCIVMPVISREFCKQAGKPCQHLVPGGCGIYPDRPPVCRDWQCIWREDRWLGSHPDYRPDRLGVMFSAPDKHTLSIWEVVPGALGDAGVNYIKNKLKNLYKVPLLGVQRYPLTVLDGLPTTPEMVDQLQDGLLDTDSGYAWQRLGGNEYVMVRKGG